MSAFRILLADDHPIFRVGLRSLLGSHERWEVCGEAADGRDAVEKCRQLKPDLLILDICMPKTDLGNFEWENSGTLNDGKFMSFNRSGEDPCGFFQSVRENRRSPMLNLNCWSYNAQ